MFNSGFFKDLFSLEGKVALVTGASGGIGSELAVGLSHAGASVAVHGRSADKLATTCARMVEAGGKATPIAHDLSTAKEAQQIVDRAVEALGRLDILVNCAGMNRRQRIDEVEEATYDEIMDVNLRVPYFSSQAAARAMKQNGGGSILHIGSLTTAIGLESVSVYGLTKSALGQLTKSQAIEWADDGIRVNCLCPGFLMTPLTEKGLWGDEARCKWMLDRIPLKRPGYPKEMVGMALLLASGASSYITGQTVYLDGGLLAGSSW